MLYAKGRKFGHSRWNPLGVVSSNSKNVTNTSELGQHDKKIELLQKEQLENSNCKRLLLKSGRTFGNNIRNSFARKNNLTSKVTKRGSEK